MNKDAVELLCGEFGFNSRGEFESKLIEITPKQAGKLLSFSEGNRRLKDASMSILVKAIKENEFVVTNNAISFDENLVLRDGHHRLKAMSIAGVPVKQTVSINIPYYNFQYVDRGVNRSQSDILSIYSNHKFDFEITAKVVATAKVINLIMNGNKARIDHKEVESIIFANRRGLKFISDNYATNVRGVSTSEISAAISASAEYVNHDILSQFCLLLSRGVSCDLKTKSNAALFCRDAILGGKLNDSITRLRGCESLGGAGGIPTRCRFYFVQYCIKQFVTGNDVHRVVNGATIDKETKNITCATAIYPPQSPTDSK